MLLKYNVVMVLISVSGQSKISPLLSILQAGHGTGKTLNSIPRELYCNMGKFLSKIQPAYLWMKKELDMMRFRHNDINFEVTYDGHQNPSKQ